MTITRTLYNVLIGNPLNVQAGTALLPSIVPTGDPNTGVYFPAADTVAVSTAGVGRVWADPSGNVGFGVSPVGSTGYFYIAPTTEVGTGGTTLHTMLIAPTSTTSVTAGFYGIRTALNLNASAYSLSSLVHYSARLASIGGATVSTQYGFFVENTIVGATNNYGFYGSLAAATGRWNFYAAGTANNAYAGLSKFGAVTVPTCAVDTTSLGTNLVTNTATTYTVLSTDHTIVQTTAASVYTLPAAASFTGRRLHLLTQFAGTVTSASSNVVPIAGGAAGTAILAATAGKYALLQSNGANWLIVAAN